MLNLLHALAKALEPFHRFDPAGWFAWRELLTPTAAMVAMAVGLFCMVIGAREGIFRFVAVPLGVLMGVTLTAPVLELTRGTPLSPTLVELGLPAVLGPDQAL